MGGTIFRLVRLCQRLFSKFTWRHKNCSRSMLPGKAIVTPIRTPDCPPIRRVSAGSAHPDKLDKICICPDISKDTIVGSRVSEFVSKCPDAIIDGVHTQRNAELVKFRGPCLTHRQGVEFLIYLFIYLFIY